MGLLIFLNFIAQECHFRRSHINTRKILKWSYLILRVEEFELVAHERVLGRLLLPKGALLLELRAPKGLDAVHAGAELLAGEFELLLEGDELPLQVVVLVGELADVITAAVHGRAHAGAHHSAGRLTGRAVRRRPVQVVLHVHTAAPVQRPFAHAPSVQGALARLPNRHKLALVVGRLGGVAARAGPGARPRAGHAPRAVVAAGRDRPPVHGRVHAS